MNIDGWYSGYKVRAFDWIDGKSIYMHIEQYRSGASLSRPPEREKSVLLDKKDEQRIKDYINTVVCGIMGDSRATRIEGAHGRRMA